MKILTMNFRNQKVTNIILRNVMVLFDSVPHERIINIDETAIFLVQKSLIIRHSREMDYLSLPVKF